MCALFFFLQKKAEEAHRILEGLGPRVELVSPHFSYYPCFTYCPSFFHQSSLLKIANDANRVNIFCISSAHVLAHCRFQRVMGSGDTSADC